MAPVFSLALAALIASVSADPGIDRAVQHDVIAWHLSQGESRSKVCAVAEQYFAVHCMDTGAEFILMRGMGTEITYLSTIKI